MANISIDELEKAISEELTLFSSDIIKKVKQSSDEVMEELVKNTKNDANKRTGAFAKAISSKRILETPNARINAWYVKAPEYRKTHLLEKGHAKRNGGRTKAYGFVSKNGELAVSEYEKKVEEVIKGGY